MSPTVPFDFRRKRRSHEGTGGVYTFYSTRTLIFPYNFTDRHLYTRLRVLVHGSRHTKVRSAEVFEHRASRTDMHHSASAPGLSPHSMRA